MADRIGSQVPTEFFFVENANVVDDYDETKSLYEKSGYSIFEWQETIDHQILSIDDEGLWAHSTFGLEVPRQNGKGEILIIRELYGMTHGEKILHTAHRTATSHSAWEKLQTRLADAGLEEDTDYKLRSQFGLEKITLKPEWGGGSVAFRTRSSKGGLGESYDTLIIDEAQEYTTEEKSALQYTIAAANNPQTIMAGTPPTKVSVGTVFGGFRKKVLKGEMPFSGYAGWSVKCECDPQNKDAWYLTNPSLGLTLKERTIFNEIDDSDPLDFIIQRLGYWFEYSQRSEITKAEWDELRIGSAPKEIRNCVIGVKYGKDGKNVSASVACKTEDDKFFIEALDCQSIRNGNDWIIGYIMGVNPKTVIVDGQNGRELLKANIQDSKYKGDVLFPCVGEIITANAFFEQSVFDKTITHCNQPSLELVVSNCEKRGIGSSGGFGYQTYLMGADISIMDSAILALWGCSIIKEKKQQRISY